MHRAPLPLDYFSSLNNKIILIPSPLALAPPTTYPTYGQGQNKMKEVVQTDGYRFYSGGKGHPQQGRLTCWVCRNRRLSLPGFFWDRPVCCCKIVGFDGGARRHPSIRRDQASSVDSPIFKNISETSYCLLYSWGINWCN